MSEESPLRRPGEHSPPTFEASNGGTASWAVRLARACGEAASAPPAGALEIVLRHLREAAGAERAFLVEAAPTPRHARVVGVSLARPDDAVVFSTSVAVRALRGQRSLFIADVRREAVWAEGSSLRALALRSALAAPLPAYDGRRAAILLDSRAPLAIDAATGDALMRAFAGLCALLRRKTPAADGRRSAAGAGPVGRSAAFLRLQDEVRIAAGVPLPVLIVGESGSGKELVARALHSGGPRARRPFVAINCAAIPDALLERELFGATRGAFTGADRDHPGLFRQADGGTVFLDEIGDMPLALQAKLLRVLQEGSVRAVGALEERSIDVRVVAATHRDLDQLVAENCFRSDLRWRLEVLVLRVPPLRERTEDLPLISERLIERLASRCGLAPARLDGTATAQLAAHAWPGNVRELESALARALLRARDGVIHAADLDVGIQGVQAGSRVGRGGPRSLERTMIEDAICAARGNLTAAAERIGWSRQTLYRKLAALNLLGNRAGCGEDDDHEPSQAGGGTRSSQSSTFQ